MADYKLTRIVPTMAPQTVNEIVPKSGRSAQSPASHDRTGNDYPDDQSSYVQNEAF
jgi:hypothetical protein